MKNILLTMRYDGSRYHGWQIQKNAHTVQAEFQNALFRLLGQKLDIKGCSRTDTGVHANMYCVSFKIPTECKIPTGRFAMAINKFLPKDISAYNCQEVPQNFHARYSCKKKEYIYKIWNNPFREPFLQNYALHYWRPLKIDILKKAGQSFLGTHDFTSFCTLDERKAQNLKRTIKEFEISGIPGDLISIKIASDGFLYNMVRIIVGTLLRVNEGKIDPQEINRIILAKNRALAGPTVRSCGLYLNHVEY